jgi:hypothetical protein
MKDIKVYVEESFKKVVNGESEEIRQEGKFEIVDGEESERVYKAQKRRNDEPWEEVEDYYSEIEKLDNWVSDAILEAVITKDEEE